MISSRDFILLCYYAYNKEIRGKTFLQKIIYFVSILFDNTSELKYKPHYYGPYSSLVASENDILKSLGFISECIQCYGGCDNFGNEITRYDFCLTEDGKKIAEKKAEKYKDEWKKIKKNIELIKNTGEEDYYALSIAAKSFFILKKEEKPLNNQEIRSLAKNFNWKIEDEEIEKAVSFLEKIELVETT